LRTPQAQHPDELLARGKRRLLAPRQRYRRLRQRGLALGLGKAAHLPARTMRRVSSSAVSAVVLASRSSWALRSAATAFTQAL